MAVSLKEKVFHLREEERLASGLAYSFHHHSFQVHQSGASFFNALDGRNNSIVDFSVELARFHRRQRKHSVHRFLNNPELIQHIVARRLRRNSNLSFDFTQNTLSLSAQLCASNAKSFLATALPMNIERFYGRGQMGYVVDCWGGKKLELKTFPDGITSIDNAASTFFLDDLHRDVAIVLTNLLTSESYLDALEFKEAYFSEMPDSYDAMLFRIYLVSQALNHIFFFLAAVNKLEKSRGAVEEGIAQGNMLGPTERLCALVNHYSLNLPLPFFVCVGGAPNTGKTTLARTLAETSAGVFLSDSPLTRYSIESMLSKKVSVVVEDRSLTITDKISLVEFARRHHIPIVYVRCENSSWLVEQGYSSGSQISASQIDTGDLNGETIRNTFLPFSLGLEIPTLLVEPSMPPQELALHVLRQLGKVVSRH